MEQQKELTLQNAWNSFVHKNHIELQVIQPEIANSWQRCHELNLDPYINVEQDIKGLELKERLYNLQHLIKVARPFMENLYNFVKGSGFQVILADENGYLLEVLGDQDILEKTRPIHLCPGGNWAESVKGTNAIGTAIVERKPVQIYAWEHFCQPNHFLTCSAAPIFDPEGRLLGVLDITGDYLVANPHTLGMVVASVNAIENQLRLQKATSSLYVAYRYSNTIIESISEGIVSVDSNGIITQMNSLGGKILGVNPGDAIGLHINNICHIPAPMLQVVGTGMGYNDKEIILPNGKNFISSAKPLRDDFGKIIGAVATLRDTRERRISRLNPAFTARYTFDDIIGASEALGETKLWAKMASTSTSTVLVLGESGTGKELFAQAMHNAGPRREGPFIAINCAALPESLIESELFGYEEGAFTGSKKGGQAGKFELASGGTIFLDEIGDMPLNTQVKLLRVLQEKKISRLGAAGEIPVDIRVIAATNKDLAAAVQKGDFREDLYYRLNVVSLRIPPLRERVEDYPILVRHFVDKMAAALGKKNIYISDEFMEKVCSHRWPGNIRELENAIERAVNMVGDYGILKAELLPFENSVYPVAPGKTTEVRPLRTMEKDIITQAMKKYKGNITKVSKTLGIGRNTLYRKIKEYNIEL